MENPSPVLSIFPLSLFRLSAVSTFHSYTLNLKQDFYKASFGPSFQAPKLLLKMDLNSIWSK